MGVLEIAVYETGSWTSACHNDIQSHFSIQYIYLWKEKSPMKCSVGSGLLAPVRVHTSAILRLFVHGVILPHLALVSPSRPRTDQAMLQCYAPNPLLEKNAWVGLITSPPTTEHRIYWCLLSQADSFSSAKVISLFYKQFPVLLLECCPPVKRASRIPTQISEASSPRQWIWAAGGSGID